MIKIKLITLLGFIYSITFAQHAITGTFKGDIPIDQVVLEQYELNPTVITTSTVTNNQFSMIIPQDITLGIYRLVYKSGQSQSSFDIIINNQEDIEFTLPISSHQFTPPSFSESNMNKMWMNHQANFSTSLTKIETLKQAWISYPDKEDKIVKTIEKEILKRIDAHSKTIETFTSNNPFIDAIIKNTQPQPTFNPELPSELQDSLHMAHYWSNINVNNPLLLNTPVLSKLLFGYMSYYLQNTKNLSQQANNQLLKKQIDTILSLFTNEDSKVYAINYLTAGFKQMGNEDILQYIDETYSSIEQCANPNALADRLEGYEKLKPGNIAPAILESGNNLLEHHTNQQTIVTFWASWCPHCMQEIPQLNAYAKENNIRVVAVSLDTERDSFNKEKEKLTSMIHYCDLEKWDSQPVKDYHVKGTPTFFLLDKDNRIIKKHTSFNSLKQAL